MGRARSRFSIIVYIVYPSYRNIGKKKRKKERKKEESD